MLFVITWFLRNPHTRYPMPHPLQDRYEVSFVSFKHWFLFYISQSQYNMQYYAGIILCMCPANERQCYIVTLSLIGWAHTQNDHWLCHIGLWYSGTHLCWLIWSQYIFISSSWLLPGMQECVYRNDNLPYPSHSKCMPKFIIVLYMQSKVNICLLPMRLWTTAKWRLYKYVDTWSYCSCTFGRHWFFLTVPADVKICRYNEYTRLDKFSS